MSIIDEWLKPLFPDQWERMLVATVIKNLQNDMTQAGQAIGKHRRETGQPGGQTMQDAHRVHIQIARAIELVRGKTCALLLVGTNHQMDDLIEAHFPDKDEQELAEAFIMATGQNLAMVSQAIANIRINKHPNPQANLEELVHTSTSVGDELREVFSEVDRMGSAKAAAETPKVIDDVKRGMNANNN